MTADFQVCFWGVRGSIACPGPRTLRYGGNTACVEVRCGGHLLILDAGTGIRALGKQVNGQRPLSADLFLTHVHYDHVEGLPFFEPARSAGNALTIWAGDRDGGIQAELQRLMEAPFFPTPLDHMAASLRFCDFKAGETLAPAPGIAVRTAPLNHPNKATGYRVEYQGRAVCYVTDTEHPDQGLDPRVLDLVRGADIVIYDSTYCDEDYAKHRGWGHSTWQVGLRLCEQAGARTFVAFHHDPDHDDEELERIAAELERCRPGSLVAREGMTLQPGAATPPESAT